MFLLGNSYKVILSLFFSIMDVSSKFLLRKYAIRFSYKVYQLSFEDRRLATIPGRRMNFVNRQLEISRFGQDSQFSHFNNPFGSDICILLQGPAKDDDVLLRFALDRYTAFFPGALIVISTWLENSISLAEKYKNIQVIYSRKPTNPGISNVNLQIESTRAGIEYARKAGAKYVLKLRTDQVCLSPLLLNHLQNAIRFSDKQFGDSKIVVSSLNTFCFRPYSISDMFMFGRIETMLEYWDIPYDNRVPEDLVGYQLDSLFLWSKARLAENYLSSKFLENRGEVLDFTLEHYYHVLGKYFMVLNASTVGQMWPKYSNFDPSTNPNNFPNRYSEVSFEIWASLELFTPTLIKSANILPGNTTK
jgi:hypothetical protein